MPTLRQRKAVEKIVETRGRVAISRIMADPEVGYDLTTAKNPKNLTDSSGYKEILAEYGLTEGLITRALVSDIKSKPKKRFFELSLGADILGMKKRDPVNNNNVLIINVPQEVAQKRGINPQPINNSERQA